MKISVENLKPNNVIDLEGDKYADPNNDDTWLENELSVIEAIDLLPNGVLINASNTAVFFPYGHKVDLIRDND
jgi:hypothetical protein